MKKAMWIFLCCVLLIGAFFLGTRFSAAEPKAETAQPGQALQLTVTMDTDAGFRDIPLEQEPYDKMTCLGIADAAIVVDGVSYDLEQALAGKVISAADLAAAAKQDAARDLCGEVAQSENGLSVYTYYYPDFRLRHIYDLYETPDGQQHQIADILLYSAASEPGFVPPYDENGVPIDYENWGLTLELAKVDAQEAVVAIQQQGGQQFGRLNLREFVLCAQNPDTGAWEELPLLEGVEKSYTYIREENNEPDPERFLTMGGKVEIPLALAESYGPLQPGQYQLRLQIADFYEDPAIPPLSRNYHDAQWYVLEFTI